MAKKRTRNNRILTPEAVEAEPSAAGSGLHAARETIESIVIAFVLAFLFRTFEAEAFVIPTGSMSPSLQGQHKDVCCSECGYRFRTTASSEGEERQRLIAMRRTKQEIESVDVIAGQCPMCRQTMAMRPDLYSTLPLHVNSKEIPTETTYPGDRILVNKYAYKTHDPERWDVVVFKFPGNGEMNYIKRLVGLPNETVRIFQGDLFVRDDATDGEFQIARKPADKVEHMLQAVHDTDYDPASLFDAGWPLRWESDNGWQVETEVGEQTVAQTYRVDATAATDKPVWLRYHHYLPRDEDWAVVRTYAETGKYELLDKATWQETIRPELIADFNPYNACIMRSQVNNGGPWSIDPHQQGVEWVGDLAVRCEVEVQQAAGEMILDLVEAGRHFTCRFDLSSGDATLGIEGVPEFQPQASTPVNKTGSYELLFANVDDQLLLWVDGKQIEIEGATYGEAEIGSRDDLLPQTSESDAGDLAPIGIGAVGAKLSIDRLEVLRDIYYIAVSHNDSAVRGRWTAQPYFTDYLAPSLSKKMKNGPRLPALNNVRDLFRDPENWGRFATRRKREFEVGQDQLFVMGDNSPASQDCRLWATENHRNGAKPGGPYLDRRLLIGKAVCVFWPHSWGSIPGARRLPGFPNFGDMRIVR